MMSVEKFLQCLYLLVCLFNDRRFSADLGIFFSDNRRAAGRNIFCEEFLKFLIYPSSGSIFFSEWELKNIGVAKKIEQKRLDGVERIGSAKLEENDSYWRVFSQNLGGIRLKRIEMPLKSHYINPMAETPVLRFLKRDN